MIYLNNFLSAPDNRSTAAIGHTYQGIENPELELELEGCEDPEGITLFGVLELEDMTGAELVPCFIFSRTVL